MLRNVNKFVVAFDANADFGTVGRAYAHEVAEALTAGLNRGTELAMVAYDGQFKRLPPGMKRFDPIEAERMLAALWLLDTDNGSPGAVQLLNALSVGNSGQTIGFLITGKEDEQPGAARDLAPAEHGNGIVPIVLQVGAQQPSELYSEACSRLGGACVVMPGALTAEGATLQLLNNMSWQPLAECKFEGAGGLQTSRLLTKPGSFSNSPILLAVALEPGAKKLSVNLSARAGETSAQKALSLNVEGIDPSHVDRRLQEAIHLRLKELLEEPAGTHRP